MSREEMSEMLGYVKEDLAKDYSNKGMLTNWKEQADAQFGPEDAVVVWNQLRSNNLLPPLEQELIFVSPTANIPTLERAIYMNELAHGRNKAKFFVGDIAVLNRVNIDAAIGDVRGNPKDINKDSSNFFYFRWDADNLPIQDGIVNAIWDRKGWIHHIATSQAQFTAEERLILVKEALDKYKKALNKDGVIILDANNEVKPDETMSTTKTLDVFIGPRVFSDIQKDFTLDYVGEDKNRVLVLKPKHE